MLEFLSGRQMREQGSGGLAALGRVASPLSPGDSRLGRGDDPPGPSPARGPVCQCGHTPFRVGTPYPQPRFLGTPSQWASRFIK